MSNSDGAQGREPEPQRAFHGTLRSAFSHTREQLEMWKCDPSNDDSSRRRSRVLPPTTRLTGSLAVAAHVSRWSISIHATFSGWLSVRFGPKRSSNGKRLVWA